MIELGRQVTAGLAGKRRIGRTESFAAWPVARRAGDQPAIGVSVVIEGRDVVGCAFGRARRDRRHGRVIGGNLPPLGRVKPLGDVGHLRMDALTVGVGLQLPLEITRVELRQPGRESAVPFSVHSVAGEAGIGGPGLAPAESDQFAGRREALGRFRRRRHACRQGWGNEADGQGDANHSGWGTGPPPHRFRSTDRPGLCSGDCLRQAMPILFLLPLIAACKPPPGERTEMALASPERGKAAIERVGCASCHDIAGIDWPKGKAGPPLRAMGRRGMIAGELPNRPEVLAAFVRNAPALVPETSMPAMPLTPREALDVAAYLYGLDS